MARRDRTVTVFNALDLAADLANEDHPRAVEARAALLGERDDDISISRPALRWLSDWLAAEANRELLADATADQRVRHADIEGWAHAVAEQL